MYDYDLDLDFFLGHCTFIKSVLENEKVELKEKYTAATKGFTVEQKELFFERHGDGQYYIEVLFPSIQWSAMFVAAYNLFEKTMNDICRGINPKIKSQISLKDVNGKGIHRAKTYLSKVHNVKEPFTSSEWGEIKKYSKLRNVLAHTYGELDLRNSQHKEVYTISETTNDIQIKGYNEKFQYADIVVKENLVFDAIDNYRKFIRSIVKVLRVIEQ